MVGFRAAFRALRGLTNYETMARPPYGRREMNLPRTRALLSKLDHPERSYHCLQVAGTKGKGTAATAMARVLTGAGHRTGLYTSPHLFDVRERIAVDGRWISKRAFATGVEDLLRHVTPLRGRPECPTFFELMTVLALHHFRNAGAKAVVLEVGLGGRLDATTAVRPIANLITQVGLDHTAILGRTRALIAAEKAGIARRGVPLVSGVRAASAPGVVVARAAAAAGARLVQSGREFSIRTGKPEWRDGRGATFFSLRTAWGPALAARPALLGRALARDAGLAAATLMLPEVQRRLDLPEAAVVAGLGNLHLPGRVQVVEEKPLLVVDGAHNPDSARSLVRVIEEALPHRRAIAILGGGVDKGVDRTAKILGKLGSSPRLIFTRPESHPRAADPEMLAAARPGARWTPRLEDALELARNEAGAGDLILVTGSLYLAGEALTLLGVAPRF